MGTVRSDAIFLRGTCLLCRGNIARQAWHAQCRNRACPARHLESGLVDIHEEHVLWV